MFGFVPEMIAKSRRLARRLLRERAGHVAITFAVSILPSLAGIGAAVDYSNALRIRAKLQGAVDSAALAAVTQADGGSTDYDAIMNAWNQALSQCGQQYNSSTDFYGWLMCAINSYQTILASSSASDIASRQVKAVFGAPAGSSTPTVSTNVDTNGVVTVYASTVQQTNIMKYFGQSAVTLGAGAQAMRGSGKVEVALVLDTTGSMSGTKLDGMKSAATSLISTLFAIPSSSSRVKASIVPFAQYVNIGTSSKGASWLSGSEDVTVPVAPYCYTSYPYATYSNPYTVNQTCYNDGAPYNCSYTAYATVNLGAAVNTCYPASSYVSQWYGCVGSRNYPLDMSSGVNATSPVPAFRDTWCSATLTRLSNSSYTLINAINSLSASGETYIPAGLLWGWRSLSPNAPFSDGAAQTSTLQKSLILMTDGANTLSPNYPYHYGSDVATSNTLTAQTCTNIKADNIRVYAVAFSVTDPTIKNILRNCATTVDNFYDATNVADLTAAFTKIGQEITAVRLSK